MTYLTEQQYLDRFGEDETIALADADIDGAADMEMLTAAIADAEATIDSYLGTRYTLPLSSVPAVLTQYCADLTRERLHTNQATEEVSERAKIARGWLKDIAAGKAALAIGAGVEAGAGDPAYTERASIYDATANRSDFNKDYVGF